MSDWTHTLCPACYDTAEPGREPARVVNAPPERCCCCGLTTPDPINYRAAPSRYPCQGIHTPPDDLGPRAWIDELAKVGATIARLELTLREQHNPQLNGVLAELNRAMLSLRRVVQALSI